MHTRSQPDGYMFSPIYTDMRKWWLFQLIPAEINGDNQHQIVQISVGVNTWWLSQDRLGYAALTNRLDMWNKVSPSFWSDPLQLLLSSYLPSDDSGIQHALLWTLGWPQLEKRELESHTEGFSLSSPRNDILHLPIQPPGQNKSYDTNLTSREVGKCSPLVLPGGGNETGLRKTQYYLWNRHEPGIFWAWWSINPLWNWDVTSVRKP